jgi:kynurenine formamidase
MPTRLAYPSLLVKLLVRISYGPTAEGKPAKTIDELPLKWFFNDGMVLDFTDKPAGYAVSISDIQEKSQKIQYQLKPFDIVKRCDADKKRYDPNYSEIHVGVSAESTLWMIESRDRSYLSK